MQSVRLTIHVRPSASTSAVGGEYDGALVIRVVEPPDKGRATAAALNAVADVLTIPRHCVSLVRGATSRRKLIDIACTADDTPRVERHLADLLRGSSGS